MLLQTVCLAKYKKCQNNLKQKRKQYNIVIYNESMSLEENSDYIIEIIDQASKLKDYRSFDFTEYFSKIESIDLAAPRNE